MKPLVTGDESDPLAGVTDEFRGKATGEMDADEVWVLVDPEEAALFRVVDDAAQREVPGE